MTPAALAELLARMRSDAGRVPSVLELTRAERDALWPDPAPIVSGVPVTETVWEIPVRIVADDGRTLRQRIDDRIGLDRLAEAVERSRWYALAHRTPAASEAIELATSAGMTVRSVRFEPGPATANDVTVVFELGPDRGDPIGWHLPPDDDAADLRSTLVAAHPHRRPRWRRALDRLTHPRRKDHP